MILKQVLSHFQGVENLSATQDHANLYIWLPGMNVIVHMVIMARTVNSSIHVNMILVVATVDATILLTINTFACVMKTT